jgi:uncharacterized protein with HEPN domain
MSQRDEQWIADILEAARAISAFLEGIDQEAFLASDLIQSAVLNKLTIIGEAANQVSPELKAQLPDVPWRPIIGFRNIIVHAYFQINWDTVWVAASERAPELVLKLGGEQP